MVGAGWAWSGHNLLDSLAKLHAKAVYTGQNRAQTPPNFQAAANQRELTSGFLKWALETFRQDYKESNL